MIESLTEEQKALFPEYREKWINIGLSIKQSSDEEMKNAMNLVYTCAELKKPKKIIILNSPIECLIAAHIYRQDIKFTNLQKEIDKIRNNLKKNKLNWNEIKSESNNFIYGQHEAGWLSFYDYFKIFKIKELEKLEGLFEMAKHCNWAFCYEDICFVSRKPVLIKRNIRGQLHCENGPALEYKDGFSLWKLNGVDIDKKWILMPREEMNPLEILKDKNVEVRKELINKIGMDDFSKKIPTREIDKWNINIGGKDLFYSLIMINLGSEIGEHPYLKMNNPSVKNEWHIEPVAKEIRTAKEAFEWKTKQKTLPFSAN